jgi:hypothetical protein
MSLVAKVSELGRDVAVARTHIVVVRRIVDVFMMPSRLECQVDLSARLLWNRLGGRCRIEHITYSNPRVQILSTAHYRSTSSTILRTPMLIEA